MGGGTKNIEKFEGNYNSIAGKKGTMEALEMFGLGLAGVIWSRGGSHEVRSTSKLHK